LSDKDALIVSLSRNSGNVFIERRTGKNVEDHRQLDNKLSKTSGMDFSFHSEIQTSRRSLKEMHLRNKGGPTAR
jgi:hypothetical protein